jgi:2-phospho-L-lactate guanylyltransferase
MQATVLTFDPETQSGTVVADAGETLPFGADAFAAGGLRLLRPGQRVHLARSDAGEVRAITIITLALPPNAPTRNAKRDRT